MKNILKVLFVNVPVLCFWLVFPLVILSFIYPHTLQSFLRKESIKESKIEVSNNFPWESVELPIPSSKIVRIELLNLINACARAQEQALVIFKNGPTDNQDLFETSEEFGRCLQRVFEPDFLNRKSISGLDESFLTEYQALDRISKFRKSIERKDHIREIAGNLFTALDILGQDLELTEEEYSVRVQLLETISSAIALQKQVSLLGTNEPEKINTESLVKFEIWLGKKIEHLFSYSDLGTRPSLREIESRAKAFDTLCKSILKKA